MTIKPSARCYIRITFVVPVLLLALTASSAQQRIVAVGDVHGSYSEFVTILQRTGLIDGSRRWIGGSSVLVQTGDVLDRGTRTRECVDLLMELERQAEAQHGKVIPLLGNHETMNITHDLRGVSPEDYAAFATGLSDKVREQAYREYREFLATHKDPAHAAVPDNDATRQKWMAEHPPGFFERQNAFGPSGLYGRWLRQHDAIFQVGDMLFVHGGPSPALNVTDIKELNDRIRSELAAFDSLWEALTEKKIIWRYMNLEEATRWAQEEWMGMLIRGKVEDPDAAQKILKLLSLQTWTIVSPDGPLWYRGLALESEERLKPDLEAMLARLNLRYIVAGHTVRPKYNITPRFDNHVFLIDTGMMRREYGGRASALEIQSGRFTAYYSNGEQQVLLAPEGGVTVPATSQSEGSKKQKP